MVRAGASHEMVQILICFLKEWRTPFMCAGHSLAITKENEGTCFYSFSKCFGSKVVNCQGALIHALASGEGLQMSNGAVTKDKPALELPVMESKASDACHIKVGTEASVYGAPDVLVKETGYHSEGYNPSVTGVGGSSEVEVKISYLGFLAENQPHMYYGYPPQPPYCPQLSGSYISTALPGYGPPYYGHVYQQVPPSSVMQYYASSSPVLLSQEESRCKKTSSNEGGDCCAHKETGAGGQSQPAQNHWGSFTAAPNGMYYSPTGYEYYTPQWHLPACGYQQTQNGGVPLSYMQAGACGRYPNFPKIHSAANVAWKGGSKMGNGRPGAANWRAKDLPKHSGKSDGKTNTSNLTSDQEQARVCSLAKSKVQQSAVLNTYEGGPWMIRERDMASSSVNRSDYNKADFQTSYESAKFLIIKSYSEDDVHKSIKYGVWSSTPNGNKRLDEAYRAAQERADSVACPVFFFFSVNSSGQFCGVAEMVGPIDFTKDMDFWLQGKWTGCFPVKWHIIKDVPNGYFRHIILANNENKPVTHSRDTQEVPLKQGLEVLKIFKNFTARTSLLDDFAFYDNRQRLLQDRKMRQQQMMVPVKHETFEKMSVASELSVTLSEENGKLDGLNGLNAEASSLVCKVNDLSIAQEDSSCSHATANTDGKEDAAKLQLRSSSEPSVSKPELPAEVRLYANADYKKALLVGGQGNANRQDELDGV